MGVIILISGGQLFIDYNNGNYLGMSKDLLDITMAGIGAFIEAPAALFVSGDYFVTDKFIGWNNVSNTIQIADQVDESEMNQQLSNIGLSMRP